MMQSLRNLAQTLVVKVLMLVLMLSFALWGIGDMFRGNPLERTVAKVGHDRITVQELNQGFEQELLQARQRFGGELSAQQAKQMGILDKTLDAMVQRSSVDQAIAKLGISVSDKMILDQVAAAPQFRDRNGKFNTALFRQLLDQAHMSERTFLSEGRKDMERRQLIAALTYDGDLPQTIVEDLYKARGQKRTLEIITLKNDGVTNIPAADDKALQGYYDKHQQSYMVPEYRSLTIAKLSTDEIAKDISISDEDVQKEYEAQKEQLTQPERRDFLQVVIQDETKAKNLAAAAKSSHNLQVSAKTIGYDSVPINQADEKGLPPELAKSIFALKAGDISDPIHTSLGWHVVQIKKITPAGLPDLKDIKDQLREGMQHNQAVESVTKSVNQLDDQLAAGHALEDIADDMKMRLIKIPTLDANGKTPDGKDLAELPFKEQTVKAGFAQNAGDTSSILDDKQGNFYVVRTDSVTPSAPKPLDQVKAEVLADWKAEQQAIVAKDQAEKMAQALRDGKSPLLNSDDKGMSIRTSSPISMLDDHDDKLPPSVLPQVFRLKKGEVATASVGDEQIIMRLINVTEAGPITDAAKVKIMDEIKKTSTSELTQQYITYLHQLFPVHVYEDTLETVRQQGS